MTYFHDPQRSLHLNADLQHNAPDRCIDDFRNGTRPACDTCGEPAIVAEYGMNHCPDHMAEELR